MNPYLVGAIAAPVVGGLVGNIMGSSSRKQQMAMMQQAYGELAKLGVPPDLSKEVILQHFQSQGILTPELEQDVHLAESQAAQITEDPSLRQNQVDVLNTLGQVSRGGLRPEDRAAYNELRQSTQRDAEAKRQQILQQMGAMGQATGGAALMSQLQSAQAAADQQSAGSDRLAADASKRALEALAQRAQQAGSMRNQDLSLAEMKAKAIDDRNRFLYENSVARQRANIAAMNQAQQANLANKQRLSEMNTQQGNTEALRQNQAKRDYWQDQLGLAQAKAAALTGQAQMYGQEAQRKADLGAGLGSAVGQGFATYGAYQQRQPKQAPETSQSSQDMYDYMKSK